MWSAGRVTFLFLLGVGLNEQHWTLACQTVTSRNAIRDDLLAQFVTGRSNNDPIKQDFVAGCLRLAFHDAGTFDPALGGGPNGCIVDTDPDNAGLDRIVNLLQPVFETHRDLCPSRSDFWALAAAVGVDAAMPASSSTRLVDMYEWGRDFVDDCSDEFGRLPSHQMGLDHVRNVFNDRMGFTDQEVVALMGAHTIGRGHEEFSGFDMAWDQTMMTFDNGYYIDMVQGEWARARIKANGLHNWVDPRLTNPLTGKNNMMLNTDLNLVFDIGPNNAQVDPKTGANSCQVNWDPALQVFLDPGLEWEAIAPDGAGFCSDLSDRMPLATAYVDDQARFHQDFSDVFWKLMRLGYEGERGALCSPCVASQDCCCRGQCVTVPPETEAPETEAPETQAPETEAPETEAPETQAPETQAPETEAPETPSPNTPTPHVSCVPKTYHFRNT